MDSQSVKTTAVPGSRSFDKAKLIKGRKRHVLVDMLGLLLAVVVTSAAIQDRDGARLLLSRLDGACKKLRLIWVDGGYRGQLLDLVWGDHRFVEERTVDVSVRRLRAALDEAGGRGEALIETVRGVGYRCAAKPE